MFADYLVMLLCVCIGSVKSALTAGRSCPLRPAIYVTGLGTLELLCLFV